ncbi:ribonuclease P protein component [Noviherbaspirillum sp.]|uniref:ribonuclease P protein component n=1 Tax=Noviherbaspirillum sp. TaxID=1926288 RepID=UPI0039C9738B
MRAAPRAASVWPSEPDIAPHAAGVGEARSQHYARDRRIVKTDEFSSVFRLRPVHRTAHFVLYARSNQLNRARLGIVAAKRFAPRAVTRNMIKRITRELFRQSDLPPIDCIVRLSKPVNSKAEPASTAKLKSALRNELTLLLRSKHTLPASNEAR